MSEAQDDTLATRPRRGQQPKEVTQQMRTQVQSMTGYGIPQLDIARLMQMDVKTLRKHFREELETGMTRANMLMAEALWKNGVRHNNVQAQIWWTKARMGWKDQSQLDVKGDHTLQVDFRWADAPPTIEAQPVSHETTDDPPAITFISDC